MWQGFTIPMGGLAYFRSSDEKGRNSGGVTYEQVTTHILHWPDVVVLWRVLQCVAVCCSVLQYVAVCCSVSQCVAVLRSVLQCVAVCCSVLQRVAACCSTVEYVAVQGHPGT